MINRERNIDLNSLSEERIEELSKQIGDRVREICDKAVEDANRILGVYGMEAKMQFAIDKKGAFAPKEQKAPKAKRKKAPKSNL